MRVHEAAVEALEAFVMRHVRGREVTGGADDVVELFGVGAVLGVVVHGDRELPGCIVIRHPAHGGVEADHVAHTGFQHATFDIVEEDGARRVGGDLLAEMLFERIIGEFETLFRAIRPKVAVHGAVDRFTVFIETGAPSVVPEAAPVLLLLEADDLGDLFAICAGGLEGAKLRQTRWPGTDDCHTFCCHVQSP